MPNFRSLSAWKRMLKNGVHLARLQPSRVGSSPKGLDWLLHWDRIGLELSLGVFQVLINHSLIIQVKCNGPIDLRELQKWEILLNRLGTLPIVERIHNRIKRDTSPCHVVAPIALFNVFASHGLTPLSIVDRGVMPHHLPNLKLQLTLQDFLCTKFLLYATGKSALPAHNNPGAITQSLVSRSLHQWMQIALATGKPDLGGMTRKRGNAARKPSQAPHRRPQAVGYSE